METQKIEPKKIGFMSLEFIADNFTYWLVTGYGWADWSFVEIPIDQFGDLKLLPQKICLDEDYSEIMIFESLPEWASETFAILKQSQKDQGRPISTDGLKDYPIHTFQEMFWTLIDKGLQLRYLQGFFHQNVVELVEDSKLQISKCGYLVTAFLPDQGVFAIRGEDYKLPESPNWITIKSDDNEGFLEVLRNFKIVAMRMTLESPFYAL